MVDWQRFLEIARCPTLIDGETPCQGALELKQSGLKCCKCATLYRLNQKAGFPIFSPLSTEAKQKNRYESLEVRHAENFTAWSFGYYFLQRGEGEGFYRTINELIFTTSLKIEGSYSVLDIGCGVGRTVCDVARHYPNAFILGTDLAERMLEQGYNIVIKDPSKGLLNISADNYGQGTISKESFGLTNVFLVQANALSLPLASNQFDLVAAINVIDRVNDPHKLLSEAVRVLKPGGYLIFANPCNWATQPEWWDKCSTLEQCKELLLEHSLKIDLGFDGLLLRQVYDKRGSHMDWIVAVVRAIKDSSEVVKLS